MIRFRSISIALIVAALAVSARAQGTTGGLLYAVDFANWTLPQGNTPAQGAIIYPNQDICKVTSNGYTFLAPKVGRPITIVDGVNTETVTPTSVVVGSIGCIISAVMTHSHSSYFLKSGTGGAQEAVDYQASQPQGANVILTPAWTQAGGTTGTITGTLKGNAGVTILDQRTAIITPYGWNGANYVAQPLGGSNISGLTNGLIPLATSPTGITANSHLDDGVTTPSTITSTEPIAAPSAAFSGNIAAAAAVLGSVPGYKQNPSVPMHNRDQSLAITGTPQDACSNAGNGQVSDAHCFNQEIRFLAGQNNNAVKRLVVPYTPNGYYFGSNDTGFQVILPYDYGDYHGSSGYITPAAAGVHFTNGSLTSCSITGGSGYAPNAQLPLQILDPQHLGSGAAAYVTTDSTGLPASTCTVQLPGINYPQIGTQATVIPIGGDGAAGNCSLSGGAFVSPCTVTAAGSGYNDGTYGNRVKLMVQAAGITCTTYPVFTPAIASAGVSAVTTTAGSGCTYGGSGTTTVPLEFGASCGGTQCTLLPMETPISLPCSVALLSGVEIQGVGNPNIFTDYGTYSILTPSLTSQSNIAFCDPWGDQGGMYRPDLASTTLPPSSASISTSSPKMSNMTIFAQHDIWFAGGVSGGNFNRIKFEGGSAFYAASISTSIAGTFQKPDTIFEDDQFLGASGIYAGGMWFERNPAFIALGTGFQWGFSGGSIGGTIMGPYNGTWGSFLTGDVGGLVIRRPFVAWTAALNGGPFRVAWDTFFETYIWKTQNRPAAPVTDATHKLSNTSTTCPTLLTVNSRATDAQFGLLGGYGSSGALSYPWFNCYSGIAGGLVQATPSYSMGSTGWYGQASPTFEMDDVVADLEWRPFYTGSASIVKIDNILNYAPSVGTDPYLPGGVTSTQVWLISANATAGVAGHILNLPNTPTGLQSLWFGVPNPTSVLPLSQLTIRNVNGLTNQNKGSISTFTATTWPAWLTPTLTNASGAVNPAVATNLSVVATAIPNSGLANSTIPINGTTCTLGAACTPAGVVFSATLTTTAATTDTVTVTGMLAAGHCHLQPTNASAATNVATTYISAKTTNQITVTHTATSGMTYDAQCTAN